MLGNAAVFVLEIYANGMGLQPFQCPATCGGNPCFEDGTLCEANMMLGPRIAVMDQLGAKNDLAIYERVRVTPPPPCFFSFSRG